MPREVLQKYVHMFRVNAGATTPLPDPPAGPTDQEKIKWLYDVLTILDSKAGALLAFDGLLVAAVALMYDRMSQEAGWLHYASLGLMLVTLAAALLCLFVAHVSYAFLGKIDPAIYNNTAEIDELARLVEVRTHRLWRGWNLSVIAVFLFIGLLIIFLFSALCK
ncbi:MAG TPA: hypothetical protein VK591_18680 [Xanthobacteraceae bacterium]|jgi:hypothetical protein|nr:hypothetical protein [Xanthobacteraceae bacterium]